MLHYETQQTQQTQQYEELRLNGVSIDNGLLDVEVLIIKFRAQLLHSYRTTIA